MFGRDPVNAGVPGDMACQKWLVVHEVLRKALVGPSVDELLERGITVPVIRAWHQKCVCMYVCMYVCVYVCM